MKYDRTMRVDISNRRLIEALSNAIKHNSGAWSLLGQQCKIIDIVRIERTDYIEVRLLREVIKCSAQN